MSAGGICEGFPEGQGHGDNPPGRGGQPLCTMRVLWVSAWLLAWLWPGCWQRTKLPVSQYVMFGLHLSQLTGKSKNKIKLRERAAHPCQYARNSGICLTCLGTII